MATKIGLALVIAGFLAAMQFGGLRERLLAIGAAVIFGLVEHLRLSPAERRAAMRGHSPSFTSSLDGAGGHGIADTGPD